MTQISPRQCDAAAPCRGESRAGAAAHAIPIPAPLCEEGRATTEEPRPMPATVVVFDAYGTLFDVNAAAREAAAEPGREALAAQRERLSDLWRQKQLGYSWLRAVTGDYCSFWQVTEDALDFALEACGLDGDPDLRHRLLSLYRQLAAFPEVPAMLSALKAAGRATAILSNGSPDMLDAAVTHAGIGDRLDAVLSVADAGVFKPDARVYDLVGSRFDIEPHRVLFVSSNGWDAAAATGYGFRCAWVNRAGQPRDRLPWTPRHEVTDLTAIPDLASLP